MLTKVNPVPSATSIGEFQARLAYLARTSFTLSPTKTSHRSLFKRISHLERQVRSLQAQLATLQK